MKEKKDIDQLFKDRFKNFEAQPAPAVWEAIEARLKNEEKRDRKVIPLWWKLGGVAALLALLFTVGNGIFNSDINNNTYTTEDVDAVEKTDYLKNPATIDTEVITDGIVSEDVKTEDASLQNVTTSEEKKLSNKNAIYNSKNGNNLSEPRYTKDAVATSNDEKNSVKKNKVSGKNSSVKNVKEAVVTSNSEKEDNKQENKTFNKKETVLKNTSEITKIIPSEESKIASQEIVKAKEETLSKENILENDPSKKSILDAIAENDEAKKETKKTTIENRWAVAPNVAPVYYSSLGNGSSIDPTFADNNQSGDVNWSYGVQVSYAVSERLSVRTGVNNVDLSYSTGGLEIGEGPVSAALKSIDYGNNGIVITAADKGTFAAQSQGGGLGNITPKSTQGEAQLIQRLSYYEVPLELKYALLDNKIGVNVIGGLSTLFLGNNEVSVQSSNFNSVLGEANNLSTVSFATNVGLGLDYKISKRFLFNIEPMFKYQLNPYTDSSVGFKPYYIGIYSGFSFKF